MASGSLLDGIDHDQPKQTKGKAKPSGGSSGGEGRNNKAIAIAAAIGIIALGIFIVTNFLGGQDASAASNSRVVIDSETGEVNKTFRVPDGKSFPYENPKTGRATLYPAEACFWTKDGQIKDEPTYVLLNEFAGKSGPTICPDCGKPVRSHNPYPVIRH